MTLTAEIFPTRIRGIANGFVWSTAWRGSLGSSCGRSSPIYLQQRTGSFQLSFLVCPVVMVIMGVGVWLFCPDHARQELDAIAT